MKYYRHESNLRSVTKSAIWRIFGIIFLAVVTYAFTGSLIITTMVTVLHHGIFLMVYYLHERAWVGSKWLVNSKYKPYVRLVAYEVVLGNLVLGTITLLLTGSLHTMTVITLTYICNKLWMYYLYDWIWGKTRWLL